MGRLDIRICAARNLVGKPDPYAVVRLENQTYRTGACKDTSNPTWNEVFKFQIADPNSSQLKFELWNKNIIADEFLGLYSLSCSGLVRGQVKDQWYILQQCKTNAELHIRILAHDFGIELPNVAAPPPNAMEYAGFYGAPNQPGTPVVGTPVAPQGSPVPLQGSGTFGAATKEGYAVQPNASGSYAPQPGTPAGSPAGAQPQRQFAQQGQQVPQAYSQQQTQQQQQFAQQQFVPQSPQQGYPQQGSPLMQQQQQQPRQPPQQQQFAQPQQQFTQPQLQQQQQQQFVQQQQPQQQFAQQQQQPQQQQQQFVQQPQQQPGYPQQQQQLGYPQQQAFAQPGYPSSPQYAQRGAIGQPGFAAAPGVAVYPQQVAGYPGSPYGIQTGYPPQAGFGSPYGTAYVPPASLAAMQAAELRAERRVLQAERNAIVGAEMAMLGGAGLVGAEMAMMGMGGYGMGGYGMGAGVVGAEMAMMGMGGALAADVVATDMMLMNGGGMMW